MAKVYHMFKAGMPMSAAGWMAVMKHLGFVICKGSVNKTWKLGEPSFQVEDDKDPIPVFLCNEMGFPFIENPSIRKVEAQVGEYLAERQIRRGILFVGPPMRIADDEDAECLVFWGRVYSDEVWLPLVLHKGSTSIEKIVEDATLVGDGIDGVDTEHLMDTDDGLVTVFAENHIDPTIDLLTRDSSSKSVH